MSGSITPHIGIVKLLRGVDVNMISDSPIWVPSPLSNALHNGNVEMAKLLLERGANIEHFNLVQAAKMVEDDGELMDIMIKRLNPWKAEVINETLHHLIISTKEETIKVLLFHSASVRQI